MAYDVRTASHRYEAFDCSQGELQQVVNALTQHYVGQSGAVATDTFLRKFRVCALVLVSARLHAPFTLRRVSVFFLRIFQSLGLREVYRCAQ